MQQKLLNLALLLTSLLAYLEWGQDRHAFLFQMEGEVLGKLFSEPLAVLHPFTVIPLLGQLLLLWTLFQRQPGRLLTYIALGCIGILVALVFFIGILTANYKILLSALPFLAVAAFKLRELRKSKRNPVPAIY
jgi:hypothetical protein